MKHKIYFFIVLFIFFACEQNTNKLTYIRGKILNAEDSEVVLHWSYIPFDGLKTSLQPDNSFSFELKLEKDTVLFIKNGWVLSHIFLSPGDSILVYADYRDFDNSIHFSGRGAEINELILKLSRVNKQKKMIENAYFTSKKTFNPNYLVTQYRSEKLEILEKSLKKNPNLINTFEKQEILNYVMYVDDWRTFERFNYYFPEQKIDYEKEISLDWAQFKTPSYTLLNYAYFYFLNRTPRQSARKVENFKAFGKKVDSVLAHDTDLRETLKLMNLIYMLRKDIKKIDLALLNRYNNLADTYFTNPKYRKRVKYYLKSFFYSIQGGIFPDFNVYNIFGDLVNLKELTNKNEHSYIIFVRDLKTLQNYQKQLNKLEKNFPVLFVYTNEHNLNMFPLLLPKLKLDLNSQFFLKNKKIQHYNLWVHKVPYYLKVNKEGKILESGFLKKKN